MTPLKIFLKSSASGTIELFIKRTGNTCALFFMNFLMLMEMILRCYSKKVLNPKQGSIAMVLLPQFTTTKLLYFANIRSAELKAQMKKQFKKCKLKY